MNEKKSAGPKQLQNKGLIGVSLIENNYQNTRQKDKFFSHWSTSSAGGDIYNPGDTIIISGNTVLYAIYKDRIIKTVTAEFISNGEFYTRVTADGDGKIQRPPDPSFDGRTFDGWYYLDSENRVFFDFDGDTISADLTLYAKWLIIVSFDTRGGGNMSDIKFEDPQKIRKPANPVRDGYKFTGWYKNRACTQEFSFSEVVDESKTLYAGWEKITGGEGDITDGEGNITDRGGCGNKENSVALAVLLIGALFFLRKK